MNTKKIISAVLSLALVATTALPISGVVSAATCDYPQTAQQVANFWYGANKDNEVLEAFPLCDDISDNVNIVTRRVYKPGTGWYYRQVTGTINLNNKNISGSLTVGENAYVTIIGDGVITGNLDAPVERLTITSGTYSVDPSAYIKDSNLAAYKVGNVWKVEDKITGITADPVFVRKKYTSTINASILPTTSTSGVKCNAGTDSNVATVTESCEVSAKKAGTTTVTITPTHKDHNGNDLTISKDVTVKVLPTIYSVDFGEIPSVRLGGPAKTLTPKAINEDSSDFTYPVTFTYTSNNPTVATVNSQGEVTGVSAGTAKIVVELSYTDEIGPVTESRTITVPVYDIQPSDSNDDNDKIAANTLINSVDNNIPNPNIFDSNIGGGTTDLKTEMSKGALITTNVNIKETKPAPEVIAAIQGVLPKSISEITYYDVTVDIMAGGSVIGRLVQLDSPLTVAIADVKQPAAGYERKYYVVAYHNNTAKMLVEGKDFKIENGKIYLISDKFSIFAVAYEDTLIPIQKQSSVKSPDTGHFTATKSKVDGASAASSSFIGLGALLAVFAIIGVSGVAKLIKKQ